MVTEFPKVSIVNGTFSALAAANVTGGGGASGTDFLPQEAKPTSQEQRATTNARFIRWLGRCRTASCQSPGRVKKAAASPRKGIRANAEINFRNGGSAEGSLARRGGRSIPIGLDLPTQHSQRPLAAPALSQAILSEVLGRRPGRNGLSAVSEAQGQGLRTLAFASSWQTGHFASAIWKFFSAFAPDPDRNIIELMDTSGRSAKIHIAPRACADCDCTA